MQPFGNNSPFSPYGSRPRCSSRIHTAGPCGPGANVAAVSPLPPDAGRPAAGHRAAAAARVEINVKVGLQSPAVSRRTLRRCLPTSRRRSASSCPAERRRPPKIKSCRLPPLSPPPFWRHPRRRVTVMPAVVTQPPPPPQTQYQLASGGYAATQP